MITLKKTVKIVLLCLAVAIAAGGSVVYAFTPMTVEAATLRATEAKLTFTEQGVYLYDRSMTVMPQISGEVLEVKVKYGDAVKKGDVLAVISASDYEYQIDQLESGITGYQAQINNLYAQEKESKATLSQSRAAIVGQLRELSSAIKDFDQGQKSLEKQIAIQEDIITDQGNLVFVMRQEYTQARDDYDDGIIELSQLNAARAAHVQALAAYDASKQQLEQMKSGQTSKAGLEGQMKSLESQLGLIDEQIGRSSAWAMQQYYNSLIESAQTSIESMNDKLGQANVVAPANGIITALPITDSNVISVAASVATISSEPIIEVFVPIREIDSVHIGDKVELILDKRIGNESSAGEIVKIEDEATVKVSALGVEERKVRVLIRPKENNLHIGYGMDVKFTVLEEQNSIVAPKTAIFEKDGKDCVWAIEDGAVRLREVTKGIETREGFVITSGLGEGDMIIPDADIDGLSDGKKVKAG